jgi:PAS domain S-box-containing protein
MEKELLNSEEQYQLLVNNAGDSIFIVQDDTLKFSNPKTHEITGYSAEELAKIPLIDLIHHEDRDRVFQGYKTRLNGEKYPDALSFRIINKTGKEVWMQLNSTPITWEGKAATLNFLRDISQLKQAEEEKPKFADINQNMDSTVNVVWNELKYKTDVAKDTANCPRFSVIRIVLSGYTDVDSITESINKGNVYKFMLKPWNDQNVKLEMLVKERTMDFEIQNQALELSRAILEDLPIPVMGISSEMMIVLINRKAEKLSLNNKNIEIGKKLTDFFSRDVEEKTVGTLTADTCDTLAEYRISDATYDLDFIPLSGRFRGKGIVMTLSPS